MILPPSLCRNDVPYPPLQKHESLLIELQHMNILEEASIIPPANAVKRFTLLMGSPWEISTML